MPTDLIAAGEHATPNLSRGVEFGVTFRHGPPN